jgi:DNA-binding NarL/FixJ family response regulator
MARIARVVVPHLADFTERTHPISSGPLRFLSETTNDVTLANWRRIQLMAKERTSVRMQAQIKTLSEQGHSIRSIARILRFSRRTVRKYLESAAQPAQ